VKLPQAGLQAIREGLRQAASAPGGTSTSVFAGWNHRRFPVHGKTGTAQVTGKLDQSWYVAYVPRTATNSKPIVVVATVEQGGFGAESAAPTVCRMLSSWYRQPGARCTPAAVQD
jgi:penicillin-binding protein 2